jgi:hypothetical protein
MKNAILLIIFIFLLPICLCADEKHKIEFNGKVYNDDRLFVLYIAKCTQRLSDDLKITTIYHEQAPDNHIWCLVTFWNVERYKAYRVDSFDSVNEAISYAQYVEPQTPLISRKGKSPKNNEIMNIHEYRKWKQINGFKEYNYKKMFPPNAKNPQENIYSHVEGNNES